MIFHNNLLLCSSLLFPFLILPYSHGYNTQKRISLDQPFQSSTFNQLPHVACVSLFHRNGRFGCGTQNQETTEPTRVIYWKNALNNNDATQEGEEGEDPEPYVVIMTEQEFNDENVQSLLMSSSNDDDVSETASTDNYKSERLLHGILVLNQTAFVGLDSDETSSSYNDEALSYPTSPESPYGANGYDTPSDQISGNYNENQYAWNTAGDSLMYRDMYGIPTVFIPDVDISFYLWSELFLKVEKNKGGDEQESNNNNKRRDLSNRVVSQFNYYMGPEAVTSEQCLTWKDASDGVWSPKCLPLGGNSVWAAAGTPPPTTDYGYNKQEQKDDGNDDDDSSSQWEQRDVILLATNMDSTAVFHDATTAANSAAANIMTLMLAAKLIGDKLSWEELDALPKQIVFAFFQGETYGYMGSRNFIRDKEYPGFQCDDNFRLGVGCTYPLRTSLNYENLGQIVGMLSVDQVGVLQTDKTFYLHADNNGGGEDFENILKNFNGQAGDYVFESSNADDGAIPPSPLVSLVELSEGNVGGVVITGYDESFSNTYHSHYDSSATLSINVDAIQEAALLLARGALASAYGNGNDDDGQNGIDYALEVLPSINNDDGNNNNNKNYHFDQTEVKQLYECLFEDGLCTMWETYTKTERANEKERTGIDLGTHTSRLSSGMIGVYGKRKPNYYVSVYDLDNGQPVVQVHGRFFAAFNETLDETKKQDGDGNYLIKPKSIEAGIYGYLNHALGRNIYAAEENNNNNNNNKKCSTSSNCNQDCPNGIGTVCAGGACVCGPSSFYHIALDESIEATPLTSTRYFQISEQDEGITPMYTEPYWSGDVGVMLYREAGDDVGIVVMVLGLFMGGVALASAMFLKKRMVKEKLY